MRAFPRRGGIAQLVERFVRNEEARGSNPLTSTTSAVGEHRRCQSAKSGAVGEWLAVDLEQSETCKTEADTKKRSIANCDSLDGSYYSSVSKKCVYRARPPNKGMQ